MASYIEQTADYWIIKDDIGYGNALVLKTSWSTPFLELVARHNIKIIRLNERVGWHDSDVSFLAEIPGIHGVDILSDNVTDVSSIFDLSELKTLSLYCKAKAAGDFANLKKLQRVSLGWRGVYTSVFGLDYLVRINILGFPDKDLSRWKRNRWLKELLLESDNLESVAGAERFPEVRWLDLSRCRVLSSLDAATSSTSIRKLSIKRCPRLRDLSPVSHLSELRELEIADCCNILSLAPICQCKKLGSLEISGTTTVLDGDMSCLKTLPNLKRVLLVHKKHYSHTADELERK